MIEDAPETAEEQGILAARRAALAASWARILGGDRPYAVAFLGSLVVAVLIVSGPLRTWADERDLVDSRGSVLGVLEEENQRLAGRVEDLNDPATIEFEAREEQGMYRPGEVPYVIIPPAVDQPQLRPERSEDGDGETGFLERIRDALAEIFG